MINQFRAGTKVSFLEYMAFRRDDGKIGVFARRSRVTGVVVSVEPTTLVIKVDKKFQFSDVKEGVRVAEDGTRVAYILRDKVTRI